MLTSSLYDQSDAYTFFKETITVPSTAASFVAAVNATEKVIFQNCVPFTDCISEKKDAQVDNAKDLDVVLPMYNLVEYINNYSKTSRTLQQYSRDDLAVNDDGAFVNFVANNSNSLFNIK